MAQQGLFGLASPYEALLHGEALANAEAKAQQESFVKMLEGQKMQQEMAHKEANLPYDLNIKGAQYAGSMLDNDKKTFEKFTRDELGTGHFADSERTKLLKDQQALLEKGMKSLPEFGASLEAIPPAARGAAVAQYLKANGLDRMITGLEGVDPNQLPQKLARLGQSMAGASQEVQAKLIELRQQHANNLALERERQRGQLERAQIAANARRDKITRLTENQLPGYLIELRREYEASQDPATRMTLEADIRLIQDLINQKNTAKRGDAPDVNAMTGGAIPTKAPPQIDVPLSPTVPATQNPTAPTAANAEQQNAQLFNQRLTILQNKINPKTKKRFTKEEAQQFLDSIK